MDILIKRETQPVLIIVHAENQKDYLFWKYEILKNLCNKSPSYVKPTIRLFDSGESICQPQYRICTRIQNCLIPLRKLTQKELLQSLNEFSLSIWMLDDAHRDSLWSLCIADILPNEENYIIDILKDKFNLICNLQKDTRYINFNAQSSKRIDEIILKNIPNELDIIKEKIINNKEIHNLQKRLYIKYNNEIVLLKDLAKILNINYNYLWSKYNKGFRDNDLINEVLH